MKAFIVVAILTLAMPALAQQQQISDPAMLQRMLALAQAQRNQFLDAYTVAEAHAVGLAEDLAKAQARIKELEPKPDEKKRD